MKKKTDDIAVDESPVDDRDQIIQGMTDVLVYLRDNIVQGNDRIVQMINAALRD